jgi:enoyl-CoA hydratase/carnithine racemase
VSEKKVIYTEKEHVAVVTLNSPEHGNVIDASVAQELLDICLRINQNDDIYLAIITNTGDKFCIGSELEYQTGTGMSLREAVNRLKDSDIRYEVSSAVALIDRPVIAAINGDALGQGLELALACDVRYTSENARFGFPQTAAGLMPMDGGTQRLPRLIGRGKALELILNGETIDAREALDIGLVSQVVSPEALLEKTLSFAAGMAAKAPIAMRYVKEAVNKGMDLTLDQGVRLEADLYFLIHTTVDRTEGIKAFQEKRKPQFKGK